MNKCLPIAKIAILISIAGLAARFAYILLHYNLDWEPDSYEHLFYIFQGIDNFPHDWPFFISVWAKPLFTIFFGILYSLVGHKSEFLVVVQIANAILWTLTCGLLVAAFRTAPMRSIPIANFGLMILALTATFAFTTMRASVSALTEISGAIFAAASIYYLAKQKLPLASLCIGLIPLARIDGLLFVCLHCTFVVFLFYQNKLPLRRALVVVALTIAPVSLWNLIGFLHTGEPLFVFSSGYTAHGAYGRGHFSHYLKLFMRTDAMFFGLFILGSLNALIRWRKVDLVSSYCLVFAWTYLGALSLLWAMGWFGLTGMARYFVVAFPYFIYVSAHAAEPLSKLDFPKLIPKKILTLILISFIALGHIYFLIPMIQSPRYVYSQWTAPQILDKKADIQEVIHRFPEKRIYLDYPPLRYFLIQYEHRMSPLHKAKSNENKGLFIYIGKWSDFASQVTIDDFTDDREIFSANGDMVFLRE